MRIAFSRASRLAPSFLCSSQESSRRASARLRESFQPKDLGWLDPCDRHRDEGRGSLSSKTSPPSHKQAMIIPSMGGRS
ncbi:hypothetical protein CFBP5473_05305 [Agrobacterium larrymoorei]|uniref:Uncharacterized protein n=1 Tax=Agrobacterium larrymoorei TaxID=160699 RepID=A0A4D7DZQ6_9HYPH|nr:hypothetical protein CFBP5473_05305 [Agrobacterium larrymoorei]